MRLTRSSVILGSLLCLPLVACGGDDGDGGGGNNTPDAKVFMDAAPDMASACAIPANVPGATLGSDTDRSSMAWISKSGNTTNFLMSIAIDSSGKNLLQISVDKPGDTWPTTPLTFETTPSNTAHVYAIIGENVVNMMPEKLYWVSSGSITFSEIGETMGAKITFSTTDSNFREINTMGADVPGGCTISVGALQVFLEQSTAVQVAAPRDSDASLWRVTAPVAH